MDDFRERIMEEFDALSSELQKAARYVVDHPGEVAMRSMRSIASDAGIHPSTLVRFVRKIGFDNYNEFRAAFRAKVRYELGTFGKRARSLHQRDNENSLMSELLETEIDNLTGTASANREKDLQKAVELLAASDRIFVIGGRSFFSAAFFFHFSYSMFSSNAILATDPSGTMPSSFARITPQDAVLAFSYDPYAANVVSALTLASERGCPIIAVTDSALSPVSRLANNCILIKNDSPSFFQSVLPSFLVVQYLTISLLLKQGIDGAAAIEATEEGLRRLGVYSENS